MPYCFNDDKSKFSLTSLIESVANTVSNLANLMLNVGNLRTDVDNLVQDLGTVTDNIDSMGGRIGTVEQDVSKKINISDVVVIKGTIDTFLPQELRSINYTAAQLEEVGISDIGDYIVISCMTNNSASDLWETHWIDHDNHGYANPFVVQTCSGIMYPLQIQAYNIEASTLSLEYRIVLMKVA